MSLKVKNLFFNYPSGSTFKGLRSISFELKEGDFLSVFGKSGSGKTTLLKCVYGLEDLGKGEIILNDEKILGPAFNLIPGHSEMKLVSQDYYVLENHSVYENILDRLSGYTDEYKKKRTEEMIRRLQLTPSKNSLAKYLSSGQRQRLSIARALADFPKVLLLDEPFSNLDLGLRDEIYSYIRTEAKKNNSIIMMVSHQPEEALKFANKVMVMEQGRVLALDSPSSIYFQSLNKNVSRLLGKCFELSKADFLTTMDLKFRKDKILLRPESFSIVNKQFKKKHCQGEVIDWYFAMDRTEVLIKLQSGKKISCYSSKSNFTFGENVFLTVNSNFK